MLWENQCKHLNLCGVFSTALLVFMSFQTVPVSAAPITFNTALPVSQGEFIVREQLSFGNSSGPDRDINTFTALTVGGYGIQPKWSVFGALPLVDRSIRVDPSFSGEESNGNFELGDIALFSRYEVFRIDKRGATTRLSPLLGIRAPTSDDSESVDIFGGLITTIATTDFNFGAQVVYTDQGEDDNIAPGDTISFDTSLQYRIWPRVLTAEVPGFLFAVMESNITRQESTLISGTAIPDSSGTRLSLSPGVQYVTQRWIADLAVTIPVADSFNDNSALEPNYTVLTSLRINF